MTRLLPHLAMARPAMSMEAREPKAAPSRAIPRVPLVRSSRSLISGMCAVHDPRTTACNPKVSEVAILAGRRFDGGVTMDGSGKLDKRGLAVSVTTTPHVGNRSDG